MINTFLQHHKLPDNFKTLAERYYQPLAQRIYSQQQKAQQHQKNPKPFFVGINGCQGSGKSTLADYLAQIISNTYALNVVVMSLDDFYLARGDRNNIAKRIHPLLATRGVPGTHDTQLLKLVLTQLSEKKSNIVIPKFNKATDQPYAKECWQVITQPTDIVILEGWCWGVTAQRQTQLIAPINELEEQQDNKGKWRRYVNQQLEQHYQALYQLFDYWVALQAPSFDNVCRWRLEQEKKLASALTPSIKHSAQSAIMTKDEIVNFIQYFQRLTIHGLKIFPDFSDTVLFLDENRQVKDIRINSKSI